MIGRTTPQERLALGVVALLVALGAGARWLAGSPPGPEWVAETGEVASAGAGGLLGRAEEEGRREERRRTPLAPGERIDPNTAGADELDRLPRVGPALAERIVAHREENGPFRSLADLDAVSGVGPALLEAVGPHLTLRAGPSARPIRASAASPAASPPAPAAGPVDVNRAGAEELQVLPGIGPALAERIVAHRAREGRFRSVDELAEVRGIGPATLERLRPLVRASP